MKLLEGLLIPHYIVPPSYPSYILLTLLDMFQQFSSLMMFKEINAKIKTHHIQNIIFQALRKRLFA